MESAAPSNKVTLSALAGGLVTLVVLVLNHYVIPDNPVPGEMAALAVSLVSGIVGYMAKPSDRDVYKATNDAGTP